MPGLVPGIHVLLLCIRRGPKDVDGRDKPGHDEEMVLSACRAVHELFSPLISGPNSSQVSPLNRIICNCSSGLKSVGLVLIRVPGR